jgi:hypothetical protein
MPLDQDMSPQAEEAQAQPIGGETINAEHTQGPIGQASGPLSQQFGEQATITTGGGDQAGRDIDKRQGAVFVEHSTVYGNIIGQQHNYYQPAPSPQLAHPAPARHRRAPIIWDRPERSQPSNNWAAVSILDAGANNHLLTTVSYLTFSSSLNTANTILLIQ